MLTARLVALLDENHRLLRELISARAERGLRSSVRWPRWNEIKKESWTTKPNNKENGK
jgi:hypothetical protein